MSYPTVVHAGGNTSGNGSQQVTCSLGGQAAAGNLIVFIVGADKNHSNLTIGGFNHETMEVNQPSNSVSQMVAWGEAAGGETTVTGTLGSATQSGMTGYVLELAQDGAGDWLVAGKSTNPTNESSTTNPNTGTTGAALQDALAVAWACIDSSSNVTGINSWSGGYTARYTTARQPAGTDGGAAGLYVASTTVAKGQTTGTTLSRSGSADQMSAGVLAFGREPSGAVIPAASAVSGGMTMTVGGAVTPAVHGAAAVDARLAVTSGADVQELVEASAALGGALAVTVGATQTSRVSVPIAAHLDVTTSPAATGYAAVEVGGLLTLAVAAVPARAAAAVLTGALTVSLSPSRGQPLAADIAAALTVSPIPGQSAAAEITGQLDVAVTAVQVGYAVTGVITGHLSLTVDRPQQGYASAADITAALDLAATGFRDRRDASTSIDSRLTLAAGAVRVVTPTAAVGGALHVEAGAIRVATPVLTIRGGLDIQAIAASSAGGSLNLKLFAIDRQNGGALVPLPHWTQLGLSRQLNGPGSVNVEYPVWGANFWLLERDVGKDSDLEVEVWIGGRQSTRVVGYLQQSNGDDVAEGATWQFTGVDMCARTDEIIIYPQAVTGVADLGSEVAVPQSTVTTPQWTQLLSLGYTGRDGDTVPTVYVPQKVLDAVEDGDTIPVKADDLRELRFNAASPGAVMGLVMAQARARGAGTDLTMNFTGDHDSRGTPWPNLVTAKWSPGTTVTSILGRLVELGLIDWEITSGKVLRLFVQGTSGALYTSGQSAVRLRRGINLAEATHRASSRENQSAVLAAGSGGLYSDVSNTSAQSRIGRRKEAYTTAGNIVDLDALLNVAQRTASLGAHGPDERTFSIAMGTGNPRPGPGQTFDKADTLLLDTTGTGSWVTARVAQWTIAVDPGGASGNVVVGDLISSRAATILKRLTDTGEGSTVVGTSLPSGPDTGIPQAPAGLVVGSYAFAGGSSGADEYATVTAGWQQVVYNTDNTACTDLAGYRVEWRQDGTEAWLFGADVPSGSTQGIWTTACAIPIYVRVRAYDRSGNSSVWTTLPAPHTTDDDTTPPGIPSTPICGNWLGTVQMSWDGRDVNGADMYAAFPDFKVAYVHMSQAAGFYPDESTQIDMIYGKGTYTYATLPNGGSLSYGTSYYFKLVAEDQRGNRSAASGQDSSAPSQLLGDDIFAGAVGSAALGELVVKTANIDNGAVNDLKVSDLSVGKLTAGTLKASMIVGTGKIASGTTGARWEGDSAGLRLYNAAGVLNVNLQTANGYALVSGEYRTTNASTARLIINPGGAAPAEMQFYPSSTAQYASIKVLTSVATGYENQAGINMKAYSARSDNQSGEVAVFPDYASISWSNERDGGTVTARIAASQAEIFIGGNRTRISAPVESGATRYYGFLSVGADMYAYDETPWGSNATTLTFTAASGGSGSAQLLQFQNNSGIQFDRGVGQGVISMIKQQGGFCDLVSGRFTQNSSRGIKQGIRQLRGDRDGIDPLAVISRTRARTYNMRDSGADDRRTGLIVEELPELLRGAKRSPGDAGSDAEDGGSGTVDLYALVTTVWEGLAQLKEQIDQLKETK